MSDAKAMKRVPCWLICLALAVVFALPVISVMPVEAQERRSLFQRLFQPNKRNERVKPRVTRKKKAPRRKTRKNGQIRAAASTAPGKFEKNADARIVLVAGDFLAGALAGGLETAFSDSPAVRIVKQTSGSSGIVRDDYYNWRAVLPELLEVHRPSVVVVMIGANDRQDFRTTDPPLARRSDQWRKEYETRVSALAELITSRNIPLVWVGLPSFASPRASSDMVAFNAIYRRAAAEARGEFVDIWDGFVSEAGTFVTSGPDINGQPARLRSSDGINITRAGRRKIAFYAEKPLRRILNSATALDAGTAGLENLPMLKLDPVDSLKIDRTNPVAFDDPELDGGHELLGANVEADLNGGAALAKKLTVEGVAAPGKPGRADNFDWNGGSGE